MSTGVSVETKLSVFISYSRDDSDYARELYEHLKDFRDNHGEVFFDQVWIKAGDDWTKEIGQGIREADAFILLISEKFINSEFCLNVEAHAALKHWLAGTAKVFPVLLRSVTFSDTAPRGLKGKVALGSVQSVGPLDPGNGRLKALELWEHRAPAWVDIVGKIYHSFGLAQPEPQAVSVQVRGASDPAQAAPRQGGTVEPSARDDTRKVLLHLIGKCDREVQCTRFDEFLRTRPTPLARPILTVGCCSDEDLPRQFIYKLREAIRIRLEKSGMPPAQYPTAFSLPPLDPERNDPVGWYTDHFLDEYGSAGGGPGAVPSAGLAPRNPKELVDRLTERPVPKFFYALAKTGSLDQALQRQRKLQEFLTAWPDLPKESPVFVVLLFTHAVRPSRMRGLLGGFFGKSTPTGFDSGNGDPFPAFANATVWGTPLPALARITGEELKGWIDSHGEPIARLVQDVNALERALFEELKRQRGLQMAELVRIMAKETGISVRF